ncbi:MAG: hypothetical protein JSS65_03365 [Armatimonadetes bacterium]|nr:hypothetical protein [Armatimonadota bacterium]
MFASFVVTTAVLGGQLVRTVPAANWVGHAGNAQHTSWSMAYTPRLERIDWTTPVDETPRYFGNSLLSHYGSICVTSRNTVVVPVKLQIDSDFVVRGLRGSNGSLVWTQASDYVMPPHGWTPMMGPCLLPSNDRSGQEIVAFPMAGGRVAFRNAEAPKSDLKIAAFYGDSNFQVDPTAYKNNVRICTPLTPNMDGSVTFGFTVLGDTPLHLKSGIAKVDAKGHGVYAFATDLSGDAGISEVKQNGAPAVTVWTNEAYVVLNAGSFGRGVLVRLNASTLALKSRVALKDPKSGNDAAVDNEGTACPVVGPDGDVYVGVLESPFPHNHDRGWLLHYNRDLSQTKVPGAFGWDDTPSIVPASMVPSYHGPSTYLMLSKYNNYAGVGGDGHNKIALLDPSTGFTEPISGITTMDEVATVLSPTPDGEFPNVPGAVREWCVNSAAVDIRRKAIVLNCEDGILYRWDMKTFQLTESIRLTAGIGEAYTATVIGTDGHVYGVSNATLFAIGGTLRP